MALLMQKNALDRRKLQSFSLQNFKLDILSNFLSPLHPESWMAYQLVVNHMKDEVNRHKVNSSSAI